VGDGREIVAAVTGHPKAVVRAAGRRSAQFRVGVVYPQTDLGGGAKAARRFAGAVEALGFDHLLAYDHVVGADQADRPAAGGARRPDAVCEDPCVIASYLGTERVAGSSR
jgi:hypothetical protein